ncbi:CGH_3_collapsed_G0023290.mRNA.1.CDS.1 [Saccharomyces cerevisiae]|nr:CGH_3_collapsed_G0023290.mRNA.1.CDS.1 [Saccharomyces cerevisiae]
MGVLSRVRIPDGKMICMIEILNTPVPTIPVGIMIIPEEIGVVMVERVIALVMAQLTPAI